VVKGTFKGLTGPCGSTTNFSLGVGDSLTIPFRIKYASGANLGTQAVNMGLLTVNSTGTAVSPFTTSFTGTATTGHGKYTNAPGAVGHIQVNPATKYSVTMHMTPTRTVPQGYTLAPVVSIMTPANTTAHTIFYPTPTGTVRFLVTGHTFTPPVVSSPTPIALENTFLSTKGLSVGTHSLAAVYSGDGVYNPARVTKTITVVAANPGTVFQCDRGHTVATTFAGSVVASAALPATTSSGSVTATMLAMTVHMDHTILRATGAVTDVHISFVPGGSVTVASGTLSVTNPTTVTASVSKVSTTISGVTGSLGAVVPIGISTISFRLTGSIITCHPTSQPAPVGSVLVSGVTLSASPKSPASPGTTVTLKATAVPAAKGGQVTFFDTLGGKTTVLGTAVVPTSGTTKGFATLTVQPPLGVHSYSAKWSGTLPTSTSNTVTYSVESAPVVTTQPSPQTVNAGTTASFSAKASGTPPATVQWQLSTDGGAQWTTVVGATGTTYVTPATTAANSGNRYRAIFINSAGSAISNAAALLVVVPPSVTTQPASQSVVTGSPGTFTAKATGTVLAVQWQISTDGGGSWSSAPGTPKNAFAARTTITSTYTTPATTAADNGNEYRAVFSNGAGMANSNAATLTVTTAPPPPPPPSPSTTTTTTPPVTSGGYRLVAANGSVYSFGNAPFYGSMGGQTLNKPIVGTASTPGDGGYWLVASDGGIFSFGNAAFYGSMGGKPLNQPIVGMASTFDGKGYWEVASDGGIFAFGDAAFYGSMGGKPLNKPIVAIAATPDGKGYWEVASDGGIFAFGDASFVGSTGSLTLNKPIVGMASTNNGAGYWLVASDGGVFSFGNAGFHGTVAGTTSASIVSLVPTADGGGYWETASNGQVFQFGDATSAGTALTQTATIVAMSD
jgi:hypothetical protein